MKKPIIMILAASMMLLAGCGQKEGSKVPQAIGEWELTSMQTKSVTVGSVSVSVYVSFAEDGTFALYQTVGEGRPRKYTGTWTQTERVLDGKYSDGKAWGSSYTITEDSTDEMLVLQQTMTTEGTSAVEVDTYKKTTIPESVISSAI